MLILVFWVVTVCDLLGGYKRFGGKNRLHLQGEGKEREAIRSSKTSVTIYKITWCHNSEDCERQYYDSVSGQFTNLGLL
jgi:hypothetical protein